MSGEKLEIIMLEKNKKGRPVIEHLTRSSPGKGRRSSKRSEYSDSKLTRGSINLKGRKENRPRGRREPRRDESQQEDEGRCRRLSASQRCRAQDNKSFVENGGGSVERACRQNAANCLSLGRRRGALIGSEKNKKASTKVACGCRGTRRGKEFPWVKGEARWEGKKKNTPKSSGEIKED